MNFVLLKSYFAEAFFVTQNPASRLFYFHIVISLAFCLIWQIRRHASASLSFLVSDSFKNLFNKNYWWNSSTRTDYLLHITNSAVKAFCIYLFYSIGPQTLGHLTQTAMAFFSWDKPLELSALTILVFSFFNFIVDDFSRYALHVLTHKNAWLWKLHTVHHSATTLTPFTVYRVHPIEVVLSLIRQILVNSLFVGFFVALFGTSYAVYTLFGISAIQFLGDLIGGTLRHSQIPISFGPFEYVFMSPKQHQIHHSNKHEHFDKNFGDALAIWDLVFKTHIHSYTAQEPLKFGLAEQKSASL